MNLVCSVRVFGGHTSAKLTFESQIKNRQDFEQVKKGTKKKSREWSLAERSITIMQVEDTTKQSSAGPLTKKQRKQRSTAG